MLGTDKIEDVLDSEIDFNEIFDQCMGRLKGKNIGLKDRLSGKYTLEEAGNVDGVTRERIRQKEASFLRHYSKFHSAIINELNKLSVPAKIFHFWKQSNYQTFL